MRSAHRAGARVASDATPPEGRWIMQDGSQRGRRPCGRARARAGFAILVLLGVLAGGRALAQGDLAGDVRLTGVPDSTPGYYRMITEYIRIEPDGRRRAPDVHDVWIESVPEPGGDIKVTCRRYTLREGDSSAVAIPALGGWSYRFRRTATGLDERGWIFGIDQARFAQLADERGAVVPQATAYCMFNAFVDFHSFCQVFAGRTIWGGGIQDLSHPGQVIVHAAARVEAPISLAGFAAPGSVFKLGEVTLELKGMSLVDGRRCALVGYDSGDASLRMTVKPVPQVSLEVRGSSHFFGDLYVDLASQTVRKAALAEFVVQETSGAVLPQKIQTVVERKILLRAMSREEFERGL
jgi:hypothetical protein